MKKLFLALVFISLLVSLSAQDFFRGDFNKERDYVIIVNPVETNIGVLKFLLDRGILGMDLQKIDFVGVYHTSQKYDFNKSAEYVAKNGLTFFHFHEVKGVLNEEAVYRQNPCSDDFRMIFIHSIGILFFGGPDIPPAVYGEENLYSETSDPGRHYFEVSFLFHLIGGTRNAAYKPLLNEKLNYMVTGFCLGMQSMNVAAGGTLYQDIPVQLYNSYLPQTHVLINRKNLHRNYWQNIKKSPDFMSINIHPITFTDAGFFGKTVKVSANLRPLVCSNHHQSVKDVAPGFDVTAKSDDGKVIEGIAHTKYPNVFAVQFHPDVSALYEDQAKVKYAPEDHPATIHSRLDKKSLDFHKIYWKHISEVIQENAEKGPKTWGWREKMETRRTTRHGSQRACQS